MTFLEWSIRPTGTAVLTLLSLQRRSALSIRVSEAKGNISIKRFWMHIFAMPASVHSLLNSGSHWERQRGKQQLQREHVLVPETHAPDPVRDLPSQARRVAKRDKVKMCVALNLHFSAGSIGLFFFPSSPSGSVRTHSSADLCTLESEIDIALDYELVRIHHPDAPDARNVPSHVSHARFQAIKAAHDVLTGKTLRRDFPAPTYTPSSSASGSTSHPYGSHRSGYRAHNAHAEWVNSEWARAAGEAERRADDRWKDRTIMAVGVGVIGLTVFPILTSSAISDARHASAARNLAQARHEGREYGALRRAEIRKRLRRQKLDQESDDKKCYFEQHRRLTDANRARLIKAAAEAREFAYNPYSRFRVGAALLSTSGDIIKGASIDNASYVCPEYRRRTDKDCSGGSICAERTAIVKAVSEGIREFTALAVTSDLTKAIPPCGLCRQVIREFCALDMPILLIPGNYLDTSIDESEKAIIKIRTVDELLPDGFGPEHLTT
ncbi:hypothetical protein EW145_g2720 [Phellinidium pouzarii]|uniref:cytidine deaminase n=1 Tax=Phellinidium pouzarii TaxID=167371 RepID=A0A4S4LA05_9AGAM|nr:hypothetical protein EW145_g2720 [Phellinidium pouzarii]